MLTQALFTNARSDTLLLPMQDASNGYVVKDIQGLDPVAAELTSSDLAQLDGSQFQNARRGPRNITMKLGFSPDYLTNSVDSLRAALYDWFMPKAVVNMGFHKDGSLFVITSGYVETFEAPMFTQDPEADISIMCFDPDLYAPSPITHGTGTSETTDTDTISYPGTSPAGGVFVLNVDRTMTDFTIYNTTPTNVIQTFIVSGAFVSGDIITINSIPGSKAVTLTRGGIDSSILFWMDKTSSWITLEKGDNHFRVFSSGAAMDCLFTYTPQYGAF